MEKKATTKTTIHNGASFRDPSGFVFETEGVVYRQVNRQYEKEYQALMSSGLYEALTKSGSLIPHQEVSTVKTQQPDIAWKTIQPEPIPFISYPYEWPFSMLKDAALLTLHVQKTALAHNMSLKDASSFNVQFKKGKPIFIDTLSFEIYKEGVPWIAYRQFTEQFLAPLCLMAKIDPGLGQLTQPFLGSIPVPTASRLLGLRSLLNPGIFLHIHAHAASQKTAVRRRKKEPTASKRFSKTAFLGLLESLEKTIKKLQYDPNNTQWSNYYKKGENNYTAETITQKEKTVRQYLDAIKPTTVWDMGANTGTFSSVAAKTGALVLAFDNDWGALEKSYQAIQKNKEEHILPLFCDLTNPTPSLGWMNKERLSLQQRGPANAVLALALVHHLAISQNMPLPHIAACFATLSEYLIIEYIDKEDSQVQKLLTRREDIFSTYTQGHFEKSFQKHFAIIKSHPLENSKRALYLMKKQAP